MDDSEVTIEEVLTPCFGANITAIHEDDYGVFLHLNDGRMISISSLPDGGFTIDVLTGLLH